RTAPLRARLGAPVRHRAHPGIIGEGHPPPAQPRRRPLGQPRPVADRDPPDELAPADPRLRRAAQHPGPVEERDHPLPQALRRPRDLPPPPRRCWLTLISRGRPNPKIGHSPGTPPSRRGAPLPEGLSVSQSPVAPRRATAVSCPGFSCRYGAAQRYQGLTR